MPAWLGPAITAGGSIFSALMGDSGADDANYQAWLNYQEQQRANREKEKLAAQSMKLSTAGQESPTGSVVRYNPATNQWESTLSPGDAELLGLEQDAKRQRLGPDEMRRRSGMERDYGRSMDADAMANAIMGQMNDPSAITADQIYGDQLVNNFRNFSSNQDNMLNNILGGISATGGDIGKTYTDAISARTKQLPGLMPSKLDARKQAMGISNTMKDSLTNRYNVMSGRAAAPNQGITPTGIDSSMSSVMADKSGKAPAFASYAMGAHNNPAQLSGIRPNNNDALRWGSIGHSLGGMFDAWNKKDEIKDDRHLPE